MEESSHKLQVGTYLPASDRVLFKVAVSGVIEAVVGDQNTVVFETLEEIDLNETEAPYYPHIMQACKRVADQVVEKKEEVESYCVVVLAMSVYEVINASHVPNTEWNTGEVLVASLLRDAANPFLLLINSFNRQVARFDFSQLENLQKE